MKSNKEIINYVLITPARNEEDNIKRLIISVVHQKHLPLKWVIVNDASTDKTESIVKSFIDQYPWIELVNMPAERDRSFAAKVQCVNEGYKKVKELDYQVIGNLDADLSFDEEYLGFLMEKFKLDSNLGVAGTPFIEDNGYSSINDSFEGSKHVAGGCQLFRKECYKDIGGYIPNKEGGIDWIAVTTARMKGWKTQSFPEKVFNHHRSLGTGQSNKLGALFDYGRKDYYLGNHPLWEIIRLLYRCIKKPYIIGGFITLIGYLSGFLTRMKRPISDELKKFHQKEEMRKLRAIIFSVLTKGKINRYDLKY